MSESVIDDGLGKHAYKMKMISLPPMAISHFVKIEVDEGYLTQ